VNGYRLACWLASGGGLILADHWAFPTVYLFMAGCMLVGVATTLLAAEPGRPGRRPRSLREAVVDPFVDYFQRPTPSFILLFIPALQDRRRHGRPHDDALSTSDVGFTKTEIVRW